MIRLLSIWLRGRNGATAIEYGLIAAGIALVIAASIFAFGDEVGGLYDDLTGALDGEGG